MTDKSRNVEAARGMFVSYFYDEQDINGPFLYGTPKDMFKLLMEHNTQDMSPRGELYQAIIFPTNLLLEPDEDVLDNIRLLLEASRKDRKFHCDPSKDK